MDQSPSIAPASETKPKILLVDDQPAKLLSYEVVLAGVGATLLKASSACEGFECLLKEDIALILIDVCMPDLDGFELAAMIREHPRFQRISIIFVSAQMHSDPHRLRGYELGALDYITVPIVPELLRAKVKVFLDLYRKTCELKQFGVELERRVLERTVELSRCHRELERRVEERTRERESALAQLFQARQQDNLGQLAEVSHDFNNLLMAVAGSLTLLDKHLPDDPRTRLLLRNATEGTLRGTALTRSLLAFSRRRDRKSTSVDIGSVVTRIEELLKHALGFGIELTYHFPRRLPQIFADEHQLELALLTVTLEAHVAMPAGGRLTIGASEEHHATDVADPRLPAGSYVRIEILSTAVAEADPTEPIEASPSMESYGENRGALSVIRMMIDQSGGALRIERRANEGTAVELWLPQSIPRRWDHGTEGAKVDRSSRSDTDGRLGL